MNKIRNAGTGNGMQGTWVMRRILYSGNVDKHFGESPQTFWGMSPNIPGNVAK